ncbi:YihA family ribosome biogenesis GTP-binding protein [Marinihelvus fidelis]|uniref:Probable GTP-binding protein EngB n=1 Tax=Marinihelvus fidelis TaxID=2613842 RepID=A0A5N0T8F4_9GAMM|nr:ribosome biogenesis GTP-binding protein YihA/YsxC [Marinihelvus fidelis]KAA9131313.1 YihA family ribosome biogenesis GTP-binding protein [Marinihelvus fidelis]
MPADNPFRQAQYLTSAHHLHQLPPDAGFEFAIAGRSNAGKSSALNTLTGQKSLARTSKTPGRTQQIVIFELDISRRIADLPGYGYAKVPVKLKQHWTQVMETYLETRHCLRGVVLVMDIRHPLKPFDEQMLNWSAAAGLPVHVLLTKADKLKRGPAQASLLKVRKALPPGATAQVFSSTSRQGLEEWVETIKPWMDYGTDSPDGVD